MTPGAFTVAAAVNDDDVLHSNLLLSPALHAAPHQLLLKRNFRSASLAYNSAIDEAEHYVIVFVHQDLFLPAPWFTKLARSLQQIDARDSDWGVVGCYGTRAAGDGGWGRVYTRGVGWHGQYLAHPEPVDTLDEIALILRKSSGLRFDPRLPHFHLYGSDICLTSSARGMVNYAFQGTCVHNTNQLLILPAEFYRCYRYMRRKWFHRLPIHTSCITISRMNEDYLHRKMYEARLRLFRAHGKAARRVEDPRVFCPESGQAIE